MEKKLLLLGMLRNQEMHGYQLNEMLGHNLGSAVALKKSKNSGGPQRRAPVERREDMNTPVTSLRRGRHSAPGLS